MRFHVYIDYTTEDVPRPFYVGKGTADRVKSFKRNDKHTHVTAKHGIDRRIIMTTCFEKKAFELEHLLITKNRTFAYDALATKIACNFTVGGDGSVGHVKTEKQLERMREVATGDKNGFYGKTHSEDSRRRMSISHTGKPLSDATKKKLSLLHASGTVGFRGKKHTVDSCQKISEKRKTQAFTPEVLARRAASIKKAWEDPELRERQSRMAHGVWDDPEMRRQQSMRLRPREKGKKLFHSQVEEIRQKYVPRVYTMQRLADEHNVSRQTIKRIIHRKCWTLDTAEETDHACR